MDAFFELPVRLANSERGEIAAAEAMEAGAAGLVERDLEGGAVELLLSCSADRLEVVRAAVAAALRTGDQLGEAQVVPEVDWSTEWQRGFSATVISERLAIRPSFVDFEPATGQVCLLIDPGQAFGTGSHSSTFLALRLVDGLPADALAGARVLDVGCGTGVLALAALALGAKEALGFDLDPLAEEAARINAADNGLEGGARFETCPIESLPVEPAFDGVLANMLRSEVMPLISEIAQRVRPGGWVIFSGLIEADRDLIGPALEAAGLRIETEETREDANGDRWVGVLTRRA